jgi:regulator of sigma E protease
MTVILLLVVLLVCVIAHEWGHFFAARKSGMLVEEFGFGIPPRIWGKKKGETLYSINALPIGGFVKIAGENGLDESIPLHRQFDSKPWYLKAIVLVAGVTMNIILAIVLFTFAYQLGMPTVVPGGTPTIVSITAKAPAAEAGLSVGDTVEKVVIDGKEAEAISTEALREQITAGAKTVVIDYVHDGTKKQATVTPTGEDSNRYIGLAIEEIGTIQTGFFDAVAIAWKQTWGLVGAVWHTLGELVSGLFGGTKGSIGELIGPVGLAGEVKSAAKISFAYLLAFTAAISVNLAVLNIMPFPALDGGRLLVVLVEAVTKRKLSRSVVGVIHGIGFLLLILLLVFLTIGDIKKL